MYILYSAKLNRYYVGHCGESIEQRLAKHLSNHSGFTGKVKDWQLVHSESYDSKKKTCARKRQIKKWKSRKLIEQLIISPRKNPPKILHRIAPAANLLHFGKEEVAAFNEVEFIFGEFAAVVVEEDEFAIGIVG